MLGRAGKLALGRSLASQTRSFAAKPKIQYAVGCGGLFYLSTVALTKWGGWLTGRVPVDKTKVHETPIVQNCGGTFMRWMGPGSRFQMYCSLLLSGSLVYQADASANMLEVLATSGAISSASMTVFFGAKRLCDKVVTDVVSCRRVGDPDEFVRVSVMGVGIKEVLEAAPKDLKLLGHDGKDAYSFALGGRRLQLDTSTGECLNRKALDILMQGRPLVTRKVNKGKKGSRR